MSWRLSTIIVLVVLVAQFAASLYLGTRYLAIQFAYNELREKVNQRCDLRDVQSFITPDDPAVVATVLAITYGRTNPTSQDELWAGVKMLYDWVSVNIKCRSDGLYPVLPPTPSGSLSFVDEVWQFPNETLMLRRGDCEDVAVLLCSMIRCYAPDLQVECVSVKSSRGGHVAVQIKVSDHTMVILDPGIYYCSHDEVGNIVFKEVYGEAHNWLDLLKPGLGEDAQVYLVFSDGARIKFNSTKQYIGWMYSR